MISKSMVDQINEQIKNELYSAYLYLSMSAYAESSNLPGAAVWLKAQASEEQTHAMKFFEFILERGGHVELKAIAQPPAAFKSLLDLFQQVYEHEQKVTALIHSLYATAVKENDYASQVYLQWFIKEQVEEEKNASQIVETLKMIGDSKGSLFQLDHQLGKRAG